jgi:cytochrome c-type biogenesis protein CcmH/NrfG
MLGNAAFRVENWETAIKAFRQCSQLDPEVIFKYLLRIFLK